MVCVKGLVQVKLIGQVHRTRVITKEVMRTDKRVLISKVIPYQCSLEVSFNNTKEMKVYKGSLDVKLFKGDTFKLMLINSNGKPDSFYKELDAIVEVNGVTRLTTNFMKCGIN